MVMVGGLEFRLSEIIGEGRNSKVSFLSGENVVAVVLNNGTLVEIPVTQEVTPEGKARTSYVTELKGERLKVYPALEVIRVTDRRWTLLSQQKYEAHKDAK